MYVTDQSKRTDKNKRNGVAKASVRKKSQRHKDEDAWLFKAVWKITCQGKKRDDDKINLNAWNRHYTSSVSMEMDREERI